MMHPDIQQYLDSVPEERRQQLLELHHLIMSFSPQPEASMEYRMPTYRSEHGWVAFASQKHYISLYTCGAHHIAAFKEKHPHIKTGKGCINIKPATVIPLEDVRQVVQHALSGVL